MARDNPYRPFTPDMDQMARAPDISGNEVNGLGETDMRRPPAPAFCPGRCGLVRSCRRICAIAHLGVRALFKPVPAFIVQAGDERPSGSEEPSGGVRR